MHSSPKVTDLLDNVQQLDPADFEDFVAKVLALRATTKSGPLLAEEVEWLEEIQQGLPRKQQARFDLLIAKRDTESLSPNEYTELLELTAIVEDWGVKRLQLLVKLAESRKLSLDEVIDLFELKPVPHG